MSAFRACAFPNTTAREVGTAMMKDRLIGALFGICLGVSSSIAVSDAFTQQTHAIWSSIGALAVLVATGGFVFKARSAHSQPSPPREAERGPNRSTRTAAEPNRVDS